MQTVVLLLVASAIFCGLALIFYNVRRAHYSLFRLRDEMRTMLGHEYAQLEALIALYHKLKFREPLPPTRDFAASPDLLRALADYCLARKPRVILECSSGVSSVVLGKCCEVNAVGHVYSLESANEYAEKTRQSIRREGLSEFCDVLTAPLVPYTLDGCQFRWYNLKGLPDQAVDLLVIDGPPEATGRLARYPAFPLLFGKLAPCASVFFDDANRAEERQMIQEWLRSHSEWQIESIQAEKGCARLFRDSTRQGK